MLTTPFRLQDEHAALYAALQRFHECWREQPTAEAVLALSEAAERASKVLAAITPEQGESFRMLFKAVVHTLACVFDEPLTTARYSTAEEQPLTPSETVFPKGTIIDCPACGEGLYKVTREVSTVGIVLDDGTLLAPLNRDIPARPVWKPLACPLCGGRLLKDGRTHTLQWGWV